MNKKHIIILAAIFLLIVLASLTLRPVPIPEEKDCIVVTGTVEEIYEAGVKDIVFKIKNKNQKFYINRGLETGLTLKGLEKDLLGKEVTIKYPDYWTLLADESVRHLSKMEYNGKTIYSEID